MANNPITAQVGFEGLSGAGSGSSSAIAYKDETWNKMIAWVEDAGIHAPMIAHTIYNFANDAATGLVTPKYSALIPAGAIMVGAFYKVSTALAGTGNISVGTSAGSSATSILGATAVSGLGTSGVVARAVDLYTMPVPMTAQGQTIITLSGTLTAGVFEVFVEFFLPQNL